MVVVLCCKIYVVGVWGYVNLVGVLVGFNIFETGARPFFSFKKMDSSDRLGSMVKMP
jgi:hypothetical protein